MPVAYLSVWVVFAEERHFLTSVSDSNRLIDLALADGNPLVLQAMSELFDRDPRFSLVVTVATAEGLLGAVMRVPVRVAVTGVIELICPVSVSFWMACSLMPMMPN